MKYTLKIQELVALVLGKYHADKIKVHLFSEINTQFHASTSII